MTGGYRRDTPAIARWRYAAAIRRRSSGDDLTDADAGNAPLELVILAPIIVLLICMVIAAGRTTIAQGSVDAAAREAARQASLARSPEAARAAAVGSARAELNGENLNCSPATVKTPGLNGAFAVPVGQPSSVTAYVTCRVSLSDLILPGLPGSVQLKSKFVSPLDPYRGRSS